MSIHLTRTDPDQLRRELGIAGWRIAELTESTSKEAFFREIAVALEFPEYFGRNLDALWDCLTDLTEPTALLWSNWERLAVDHRKDWSALLGLLEERTRQQPGFSVHLIR